MREGGSVGGGPETQPGRGAAAQCVVPGLKHKKKRKAKKLLAAANCTLGKVKRRHSSRVPKGKILQAEAQAGHGPAGRIAGQVEGQRRAGLTRWAASRQASGARSLAGVAACAVASPAAAADYSKSSYGVPVTAPDEFGNPVTIETDVYLPDGDPPAAGLPLLEVFHGGGSNKDNALRRRRTHARFAEDGYVVLIYSRAATETRAGSRRSRGRRRSATSST